MPLLCFRYGRGIVVKQIYPLKPIISNPIKQIP